MISIVTGQRHAGQSSKQQTKTQGLSEQYASVNPFTMIALATQLPCIFTFTPFAACTNTYSYVSVISCNIPLCQQQALHVTVTSHVHGP